jgi:hypothetical protein
MNKILRSKIVTCVLMASLLSGIYAMTADLVEGAFLQPAKTQDQILRLEAYVGKQLTEKERRKIGFSPGHPLAVLYVPECPACRVSATALELAR